MFQVMTVTTQLSKNVMNLKAKQEWVNELQMSSRAQSPGPLQKIKNKTK